MVESLIENVHRENLKPVEQAKAILEVFKAETIEDVPSSIDERLPQKIKIIENKRVGHYANTELTKEEGVLNGIVKKIGLTHRVIYQSLNLLKLPPNECLTDIKYISLKSPQSINSKK